MHKEAASSKSVTVSPDGVIDNERGHLRVDDLHVQIETTKNELLQLTRNNIPRTRTHSTIQDAISVAKLVRDECMEVRIGVHEVSEYYRRLKSDWSLISRRRKILQTLKSTLLHIQRIRTIATDIDSAMQKGDPGRMSQLCIEFEALQAAVPFRMEERFTCLHTISDRVALAVAESMRMLKTALRNSCLNFDRARYGKCMQDFKDLGALSHFAAHVLQVFEDEANNSFQDSIALDAKASQIVMSFCSKTSTLLTHFESLLQYHRENVHAHEEDQLSRLHRLVASHFTTSTRLFHHLMALCDRILVDLKFELLQEQIPVLLAVLEGATTISERTVHSFATLRSISADLMTGPDAFSQVQRRPHNVDGTYLRRSVSRSTQKYFWRADCYRPHKAVELDAGRLKEVHSLALEFLVGRHLRHAEELSGITSTPESWIRVKLTADDVRSLMREMYLGIGERILNPRSNCAELREQIESQTKQFVEQNSPASLTFTSASLAMLRWVSEYATIGISVSSVFPDAVSNITDLFLILVQCAVDVKSRIGISRPEPFLRLMEDLLTARPREKQIEDCIRPAFQKPFRAFVDRYGGAGVQPSDESWEKDAWHDSSVPQPNRYTDGVGKSSPPAILFTESIVYQCVASEGIGTFCKVLDDFSNYLELCCRDISPRESSGRLQMASLRSAVQMAKEVQQAIYRMLAWGIVGGWDAVFSVVQTCRTFHDQDIVEQRKTATLPSHYVDEMLSRVRSGYSDVTVPPSAAERLAIVVCETAMDVILEGFSRVRYCSHTAAVSQMLLDVRTMDLGLVEHTGLHPCPGRKRTEMYIKATFLAKAELSDWVDRNRRKLNLSDAHVHALLMGPGKVDDYFVVDEITSL